MFESMSEGLFTMTGCTLDMLKALYLHHKLNCMEERTIHEGRNVKRIREMLGIK